VARLDYTEVGDPPAESAYHAEYWNTPGVFGPPTMPSGPPDLQRDDESLDFDWGEGSPGTGVTADRFVARWTKTVALSAGVYRFSGGRDDGLRAYIDNVPVIDAWTTGNADYSVDRVVAGGPHDLRVEYFEAGGGARAEFTYDRIGNVVPDDGGYDAEYFANRTLSGFPALTRTDDAVDFDWGGGAPGDGVPADNFSARWTKSLEVAEEATYKFTATADDGVRLYVDGEKVLDKWIPQSRATHTVNHRLTAGTHQIVLEYFEAAADAVAKLSYERTAEPPPPPPEPFDAEYFDNRGLSGAPALTRTDNAIDFDWGGGAPGDGVPADNFSARWTKSLEVAEEATYNFAATADDGVRLYVDGEKVLDKWIPQSRTTYTVNHRLTAGTHQIVLEYFEAAGDAVAKLSYQRTAEPPPPPPPPPEPFVAEYFDNSLLLGAPVVTRNDNTIDFDWGESTPDPLIPADRFSARWTRTKDYTAGAYRFSVTGDDGIRVLLDGTEVVNGWFYQAPTTYSADVQLTEGQHTVVVEYFEHTGGAVARFSESKLPGP
jgi:hypothetical protein